MAGGCSRSFVRARRYPEPAHPLHTEGRVDHGASAIRGGEQTAGVVVEPVPNVAGRVRGDIEQELATATSDGKPIGKVPEARRLGDERAAGIVQVVGHEEEAVFI